MAKKAKKTSSPDAAATPPTVGKTYKARGKTQNPEISPEEFDFAYSTPGPFCEVKRLKQGRCATQLNFVKGQPVIRLCGEYGKPGRVVPVKDAQDAQNKANKFCKVRAESRDPIPVAPGSGEENNLGDMFGQLLGLQQQLRPQPRPKPPQRRTSPWLMFGLIGGIVGATLLKRLTPPAGAQ